MVLNKIQFALWIGIIALFLVHCESRERSNPLDPQNPNTSGKPVGLSLISEDHTITLSWEIIPIEGLDGYRIYRQVSDETSYNVIAFVDNTVTTFKDQNRVYGAKHSYKVSVLTDWYESPLSDALTITPGPNYAWISDLSAGQVVRLTHDLQHVLQRVGNVYFPTIIAVNPKKGSAWVVDSVYDNIKEVSSRGEILTVIEEMSDISDIAIDYNNEYIWVATEDEGKVAKYTFEGDILFMKKDIEYPSKLAVDMNTADCYVVDQRNKEILKIDHFGGFVELLPIDIETPKDITVNKNNGHVWIAGGAYVHKYKPATQELITTAIGELENAMVLAVNDTSGQCWVVDQGDNYFEGSVVLLSDQCDVERRWTDLAFPYAISLDYYNQISIVLQSGSSSLTRISWNGGIDYISTDFESLNDVAIENH